MKSTLVALLLLGLLGCRNGYGPITPVSPLGTYFSPSPTVDSLRPILRWQPVPLDGVTYDIVIYKQYDTTLSGPQVYYREGISATEHQVEDHLKPGTKYLWSVRMRQQDQVSPWATWHGNAYLVLAAESWSNRFFGFETPSH